MKRTIALWQLVGFAATSLLGTLLHFLYEWLDGPVWLAPFCGVNESTFEHMKLLFWPMLLFTLLQWSFFRDRKDFLCVKLRGTLLGLTLIPVLFYTYNGAIGKSPDWINIAIFFLSAAIAYLYETHLFFAKRIECQHPKLALCVLFFIGALFALCTFLPPNLGIFIDPLSGTVGI